MKLSIIVPIYNEVDNIPILHERLTEALEPLDHEYEVILINDGSSDGSTEALDLVAQKDVRVKVLHFRRNCGQTAAMMAGIDWASGDVIIPMDGDLQNDPADIPKLLAKLEEGYDVCSGWRKDRKDNALWRNFPSRVANWLISKFTGVKLHDTGCSLKAYRAEVIKDVKLYGEMHRFIPVYASWQGAKITEVPVNHAARTHGESKYGIERTFKVILDLILICFMARYSQKPIHVFGGFGLANFVMSVAAFFGMIVFKFWWGISFTRTPLPLVSVAFFLVGWLSILLGFLAELLMRTYYESQGKDIYLIRAKRNIDAQD